MSMTRYDPWNIINQMNEILGSSSRNFDNSSMATSKWAPAVDILEEQDKYVINADLPGVKTEDIEVSMENGVLSIKGERREEAKEEGKNYSRIERIYGTFHRQFSLPDIADSDNIQASYNNGVLKLCIPKKEAAKPKRISISSDGNNNQLLEHQPSSAVGQA